MIRANEPCNELGKGVSGRANSNYKIPKARMSLTVSRSGKKTYVVGATTLNSDGERCKMWSDMISWSLWGREDVWILLYM